MDIHQAIKALQEGQAIRRKWQSREYSIKLNQKDEPIVFDDNTIYRFTYDDLIGTDWVILGELAKQYLATRYPSNKPDITKSAVNTQSLKGNMLIGNGHGDIECITGQDKINMLKDYESGIKEFEERNLCTGDTLLSCCISLSTYSILMLNEPAIAVSPGFSGGGLGSDSWFMIKTESGELYYVGDEPGEYESFEELVDTLGEHDDPFNPIIPFIEATIEQLKTSIDYTLEHN